MIVVKLGKIYNEDCQEMMGRIEDASIDLIVTDPPYGSGGRDGSVHLEAAASMFGNRMLADSYIWLMRSVGSQCYRITKSHSHCYIFTDWRRWKELQVAFEISGWELRSLLVWDKSNGMGEFWRSSYELILFFTKRHPRRLTHGGCYNVLSYPSVRNRLHPTEKPIDLCVFLIEASSLYQEIVFDPFVGSGAIVAAAEKSGRRWLGSEINPPYCAIAQKRITEQRAQFKMAL